MWADLKNYLQKYKFKKTNYEPCPFPPPYQSMLAINSDVEWTTWPAQIKFIEEFGIRDIETSFSYWMFCSPKVTWSFFDDSINFTKFAKPALNLARSGILDTNHSFGGKKHAGGCNYSRKEIKEAYSLLESEGVVTPVYSNHGGKYDIQNVGGIGWASYQEGDLEGSDSYHLDLTLDASYKFFWCDPDYTIETLFLSASINESDSLFVIGEGRDGNHYLRFRRTIGVLPTGPSLDNFKLQLEQVLDNPTPGYAVMFQHLGVERRSDGTPKQCKINPVRPDFYEILDKLSLKSKSEVLVTTTSKLLNHAILMAGKPWTIEEKNNFLIVQFDSEIIIENVKIELDWESLNGWCIPMGNNNFEGIAILNGIKKDLDSFSIQGKTYLGFRWARIEMMNILENSLS